MLLAAIDILRIRHDLDHGKRTLTSLDFSTVDQRGGVAAIAKSAGDDLHRAARRAQTSPWLSVLSYVPIVSDQVQGARDLTRAADKVGALGTAVANDVQSAMDRAAGDGPSGRVPLVDAITAATDRLEAGLREVDVGAHGRLLPPLSGARRDLVRQLAKATQRLDDGRTTLGTLRSFLIGPRRYLILGGNNAEMRTVGIATTSGVATIANGSVEVGDFIPAHEISKPGVPLPEGWDWLYGFLDPGTHYSNVVASANFPLSAKVASDISGRTVEGPVQGVIYVDTVSLQTLLSAVGPVTVDGVTYDGQNAASILINQNYLRYSATDRDERRDSQGKVAKAIFDALNTRHVSLTTLASTLQTLAKQRHLLAWSSLPSEEELWKSVGADGTRSPNDLLVASQELGTSKLDYYVTGHVQMNVKPDGANRRIGLSVSMTNPPKGPTSPYIDGGSIYYARPGEYGFYLTFFLPHDALDIVHDDPSWNVWATDGDLQVTTFIARAPEGTTRTIDLSFALPAHDTKVVVVPSGRLRPMTWSIGGGRFDDRLPTVLDLGVVRAGRPDPQPGWAIAGLLLFACGAALLGDGWGRGAVAGTAGDTVAGRRAKIDADIGWWLAMVGLAMVAVEVALYVRT